MKSLAISLGLGCSQFMINQFCGFFEQPVRKETESKIIVVDSRWECARCGNDNSDWSSICGRCGRSR